MRRTGRRRLMPFLLAGIVVGMIGLTYASVPLYRLFCQATGYDGSTARAARAPAAPIDRTVTVRFNADVNGALPWSFQPVQRQVTLRLGEPAVAYYRARNLSSQRITGTATFNVTPFAVGPYFNKIQCFCFTEQTLEPGQSADLAVQFFVDPRMLDDPELPDVRAVTLSYTFFRAAADPASAPKLSSTAGSQATGSAD